MSVVKVLNNQNIFDIAIQTLGNVTGAYDLAFENGIGITDNLELDNTLTVNTEVIEPIIVNFYTQRNLKPATAYITNLDNDNGVTPQGKGIGRMQIGVNFCIDACGINFDAIGDTAIEASCGVNYDAIGDSEIQRSFGINYDAVGTDPMIS